MENIWEVITKFLSENAPTIYTLVGSLSTGSFIVVIIKGIPKLAQLIGLKENTVNNIEKIIADNESSINSLVNKYTTEVQKLVGTFNNKLQLLETKNALFFEMLYTISMNSNVQNGVKAQLTEILKNYEKLTTTTLSSIEKELEDRLKEDILSIPEAIQKENEALTKQEENISAVENIVNTLIE